MTPPLPWQRINRTTHVAELRSPLRPITTTRFVIKRDPFLRYHIYVEDLIRKRRGGFRHTFPSLLEAQSAALAFREAQNRAATSATTPEQTNADP